MKALRAAGFEDAPVKGKGSHVALTKAAVDGALMLVIVPDRKNVPVGTLRAIIRQSGLTREEFLGCQDSRRGPLPPGRAVDQGLASGSGSERRPKRAGG
ncbi:MAG: type II toxin-antitoxin system HicA family toxin [Planctomycetota bacterium]